jgi:hypothetical protein
VTRFSSMYQPPKGQKGEYWDIIPLEGLPIESRLTLAYLEADTWILSPNIAPIALYGLQAAKITKKAENAPGRLAVRWSCRYLVGVARHWRDLYLSGRACDPRVEPVAIQLQAARHFFHHAWPYDSDPFPLAPCEWERREAELAAIPGEQILGTSPDEPPTLIPPGTYYELIPEKDWKLDEINQIMSEWPDPKKPSDK